MQKKLINRQSKQWETSSVSQHKFSWYVVYAAVNLVSLSAQVQLACCFYSD